jgi:hypothetical protein
VPAAAPIERAQVDQQPMQGCVEVRRLFGDPLAQRLQILEHGQRISQYPDIANSTDWQPASLLRSSLVD